MLNLRSPAGIKVSEKLTFSFHAIGRVTTLAGGAQGYKDGKGEEAKFHHTSGDKIENSETLNKINSAKYKMISVMLISYCENTTLQTEHKLVKKPNGICIATEYSTLLNYWYKDF